MQRMESGSVIGACKFCITGKVYNAGAIRERCSMDTDDLEPIKKKPQPKDLSRMSIGDLKEYIADLQAEIARAEAAIVLKDKARAGAASTAAGVRVGLWDRPVHC